MKNKEIFLLILIFCISACDTSTESNVISKGDLPFDPVAILNENNSLLGDLLGFDFITKTDFIVATKSGFIVTYNTKGDRLQRFSKIGTGPYEYLFPSVIKVANNKIYVWCEQLLKLIVYDIKGKPLEEYSDFSKAIKDFVIRDNIVYFYMSGGGLYALIEKYDLKKRESIGFYGKEENEDEAMSLNACSGGLLLEKETLHYIRAGSLSIESVNNDVEKSKLITDNEFVIKKLEDSEFAELKNSMKSVLTFISNNSYVTGLFKFGKNYIVKTEIGSLEYESFTDLKTWDTSKRFEKYYILDENFTLIETYTLPYSLNRNNCWFQSNGENLYFIDMVETAGHDDYQYRLNKVNLGLDY